MTIKAGNKITPYWYTPLAERDAPDPKTRFHLRPLTELQRMEAAEIWVGERPDKNTRSKEIILRFGLVGWEHFNDANGPVAFTGDPEANLARLNDGMLINELADEIWNGSSLTETERKN